MDTKTLAGKYEREGSRLKGERELLIVTRPAKERTRAKTSEYILEIYSNGDRAYVSSLWPTTQDGTYRIEYNRTRYEVNITESVVFIDEVTYTPEG
jgi:hypothetical protein